MFHGKMKIHSRFTKIKAGAIFAPARILSLQFFAQRLDAVRTHVLAFEVHDALAAVAKYAGRLVLTENDGIALHIYLKRIPFRDVQRSPEFYRKNNSPECWNGISEK